MTGRHKLIGEQDCHSFITSSAFNDSGPGLARRALEREQKEGELPAQVSMATLKYLQDRRRRQQGDERERGKKKKDS